jgi:hypothetical protein
MADNYKSAQKHREWVTLALTRITSDIHHIKEKTDAQERHLSKQNDRIGKAENAISMVKGVGSVFAIMFTSLFGYFFNKN